MSNPDIETAKEFVKEIQEKVDDLPEAAEEFGASVVSKANGIMTWIDQYNRVTPRQLNALENMLAGIDRWMEQR